MDCGEGRWRELSVGGGGGLEGKGKVSMGELHVEVSERWPSGFFILNKVQYVHNRKKKIVYIYRQAGPLINICLSSVSL